MRSEDLSSDAADQFGIDVSRFFVESIPDTGIKFLRPRPESEPKLSRQLDIRRRLELLRRCADRPPATPPSPAAHTAPPHLQDVPGSDNSEASILQDVAVVGESSAGETIYLILSTIIEPLSWTGGWFLASVPSEESALFQAYLEGAREAIVAQLQNQPEAQP
jgi:hypothetical protein